MFHAPQQFRTYFLTASTMRKRRLFQVEENARLFVDTLISYRVQRKFELHSFVVMPDHIHVMLTPAPDVSFEKTVQLIKGGFSFRLKSKREVWERDYWGQRVPDSAAYDAAVRYIHRNPVKAGLCVDEKDFPFSSAGGVDVDPKPVWFV